MSPTARLTATFMPLLSPPVQISLRSLRWLSRRPPHVRPPSSSQCRSLHLYKTARAKTMVGMQKILRFKRYDPPDCAASDHKINIVKFIENENGEGVKEMVAEGLTLQQVWDDYVGPGKMLRMADTIPKVDTSADVLLLQKRETAQRFRDYVIFEAYSTRAEANINGKKADKARGDPREIKHLMSLREVHFVLQSPVQHFAEMMDKAYQFITLNCPVEFDIVLRHITEKKFSEIPSQPEPPFDYAYKHFPHLRPDFILKSMPTETKFLVQPVSDGRHVQFVLGRGTHSDNLRRRDLTKRVLNVKTAIMGAMEEEKTGRLPKSIRSGRDGNESLDSGNSREAREEEGEGALATVSEQGRAGTVGPGDTPAPEDMDEEKRAQWAAWTAGGANNEGRYIVPRAKDVWKLPDRSLDKRIRALNAKENVRKKNAKREKLKAEKERKAGGALEKA